MIVTILKVLIAFALMILRIVLVWGIFIFIVVMIFRAIFGVDTNSTSKPKQRTRDFSDSSENVSDVIVKTIVTGKIIDEAIKSEAERQKLIEEDPMSEFR